MSNQQQLQTPDNTASVDLGPMPARRLPVLHYFTQQKKFLASQPVTVAIILSLAVPSLVESFISAFIGLTDTFIAGRTGNTPAQIEAAAGAIGMMTYLQWLAGLMVSAFGAGATAIVARSIGAKRNRVANRVAGTAVSSALVVGIITAVLFFVFARQIVGAVQLSGLTAEYGRQYLQIMAVTIFLQSASQIGMSCLRGAGDTVRPMLVTAAVSVVNLAFSWSLTFGVSWLGVPALGVRGNALGTMLAFVVNGAITLYMLLNTNGALRVQLRHFRIVPHVLLRIVKIGLPSWFENMLLFGGQFLIVLFVVGANKKLSAITMAAHNATLRIESLAFMPGFAFGIAAGALVGQYLGAQNPVEAKRAALLSRRLGLTTMVVAALPMVLMPSILLRIMVESNNVVAMGTWPLVLAGLAQPGFAYAICMGAALRGAGDTFWPMVTTLIGMFAVRLPVVLLAAYLFRRAGHEDLGLLAVWIGIFVDLLYRGVQNTAIFARGKWVGIKV